MIVSDGLRMTVAARTALSDGSACLIGRQTEEQAVSGGDWREGRQDLEYEREYPSTCFALYMRTALLADKILEVEY